MCSWARHLIHTVLLSTHKHQWVQCTRKLSRKQCWGCGGGGGGVPVEIWTSIPFRSPIHAKKTRISYGVISKVVIKLKAPLHL